MAGILGYKGWKEKKLRHLLPVPMQSRSDFSLWSVLKNCVGKELSKITMPVIFNEPLSFLQRMAEYMEYAHLLSKASEEPDPDKRMQLVAAFAVSALASNWERLGKPFNPLLGETYELEREEFRVVCEQVSHHPPVSAFHADSPLFIFHGSIHPKLKFWGKSVEIEPKGMVTVELISFSFSTWWVTSFLVIGGGSSITGSASLELVFKRFRNGLCLGLTPLFQPPPSVDDRGPCLSFRTFELSRHLPHVGIPSQSVRYILIPVGDLQSFSLSTHKGS
uniref:Oxysterol-binding protein n=1 Tax=Timema douglasi TaxID=61478 RepID=A0A7R8VND4_TIMDO|nr:unnamed protein product [Timema douglasi]